MSAVHNAIRGVLDQVASQAAALPEAVLFEFMPVLVEAHHELRRDLARWLRNIPDGAQRFTAQQYRQALLQIRTALQQLGGKVPVELMKSLARADGRAGALALDHLESQVAQFSKLFGGRQGLMAALPFDRAAMLSVGKEARLLRYQSSVTRYGADMVMDIRRQLAIGVVRGETFSGMTERLARMGGPKGMINMGRSSEMISEGLFKRHRYWAERIVRTEVLDTYNQQEHRALLELEKDDPGWKKRWDATMDLRVCRICRELDGEVRELHEKFTGGYDRPPAHPQCRCGITPWRPEWGSGDVRGPKGPPADLAPAKPTPGAAAAKPAPASLPPMGVQHHDLGVLDYKGRAVGVRSQVTAYTHEKGHYNPKGFKEGQRAFAVDVRTTRNGEMFNRMSPRVGRFLDETEARMFAARQLEEVKAAELKRVRLELAKKAKK